MIEVKDLKKKYGSKEVLRGLTFSVPEGIVLGFLGQNGAGKSTTMNIITGYLSATDGEVTVGGFNVLEEPDQAKRLIGYLPEQPPLYMDMTVEEYLDFVYDLKQIRLDKKKHIEEICALVGVDQVYKRLIANLSKGYKQRVGIVQALIGNPPVLILDEPTEGLDPKQRIEIRNLITELGKTHTVILSSHILSEIQEICERIIIIKDGMIAADDSTRHLTDPLRGCSDLLVQILGPADEVRDALLKIAGISAVLCLQETEPGVFEYDVSVREDADVRRELFGVLSRHGWPLMGLRSRKMSLEETFLRLTE